MARRCVIAFLALTLATLQAGSLRAAQNMPASPTPEAISDLRARLTAIERDLQLLKETDQGVNADLRSRLTGVEHDFQALRDSDHQAIDAAKDGVQKDLSRLQAELDTLSGSLSARVSDIDNGVGHLEMVLSMLAAVLTVVGLVSGGVGYITFAQRAREQAAEAAERWMNDHSAALDANIRTRVDQIVADA